MSRRPRRRRNTGRARALALAMAALALAACGRETAGPGQGQSIAGTYILVGVLPTGSAPDILAGRLTLGRADPEPYTYPPSGLPIPLSCVHEIPNGALVDTASVVHLPDGSSYKLPRCGRGPFTLIVWRSQPTADGSSRIVSDSTSGLYTWGLGIYGSDVVTLVDAELAGPVTFGALGPVIQLAKQHVGPPPIVPGPPEPVYLFTVPAPD